MSFYRSSTKPPSGSRWGIARSNSFPAASFPAAPSPRTCMFGSSCVKFGCPFKHPSSRPRDCPAGDRCEEVMCLLHHPKTRPIRQCKRVVEYKENSRPCGLSFSDLPTNVVPRLPRSSCPPNVVPRQAQTPQRPRARSASRSSNRIIVRSPMVVPSPRIRATTGYFAATTKPCINAASCLKYGCTYKHPSSRVADCPVGSGCEDANCVQLHPLNVHGMGAVEAGFEVGQKVQARYLPSSTKWSDATIHRIRGSVLALQFIGFDDVCDVPLQRVRHLGNAGPNYPPTLVSPCPRTAPPTKPPSPSMLSDVKQLECLKLAAVAREDFIVADQIKQRIVKVKKITELQNQKQEAVREENFMLAMQLKQQIDELEKNEAAPTPTTRRCAMESIPVMERPSVMPVEVK